MFTAEYYDGARKAQADFRNRKSYRPQPEGSPSFNRGYRQKYIDLQRANRKRS